MTRDVATGVVTVLAVSDEVDERLYVDLDPVRSADVILACGDLPFAYLRYLVDGLDRPLAFVPGNHDPDVSSYTLSRAGLSLRAGMPTAAPWPAGAVNADGRVVEVGGLRIAGLGGCPRYRDGPNQYSQRQQARRARGLAWHARWSSRIRRRGPIDILLTHAPPRGVGDGPDPAHHGFDCLPRLVERLAVPLLLHGHAHPFGEVAPDRHVGSTVVRNVVGRHLFEVTIRTAEPPGAD